MIDDDWQPALERLVARTGNEFYRTKCAESHPNHVKWRRSVVRLERQIREGGPSLLTMARTATAAVVDTVRTAAKGEQVLRSAEEQEACLAICRECEFYDRGRCRKCGCIMQLKTRLLRYSCPVAKW
jgi:hypothetical protein